MDELFSFFMDREETTEAYYEEEEEPLTEAYYEVEEEQSPTEAYYEEQQQQPPTGYPPVTTESYYEEQQQQPAAGYPPVTTEAYYEEQQQQPAACYPPVTTEAYYEEQQQQPAAGCPPVTTEAYYEEQQHQPPAGYPPVTTEAYYEEEEEEQQQQPPIGYPPALDINLNDNNYYPGETTSNHNPMMMNQQQIPAQNYQPAGPNIVLVQPSRGIPTYTKRIAVIGSKYCSPDPVDLIIKRKVLHLSHGNFVVEDVNRNLMFKIKDGIQLLHDRRVLRDAEGKSIVTMQEKILTAHNRWNAFKGDKRDSRNLLFCAKESSLIQFRTKLDVFLASNGTEGLCDFKVKGSWSERSCVIYDGESNNIIAQMHKKITFGSMLVGKDKFMVTVYPNVDSAFIVALIVILDAINE